MSTDKPHDRYHPISSSESSFSALWIGLPARDILSKQKAFTVRGVTSRGVFLETEGEWITFLSSEKFHGPLTLNIVNYKDFPWIEPGLKGLIDDEFITFSTISLVINHRSAQSWDTFGRVRIGNVTDELAMRNSRVASFGNSLIHTRRSPNEYFDSALFFFFSGEFAGDSDLSPRLTQITHALISGELSRAEGAISFLVGRGLGLTPSGDDFLSGVLYGLALCGQYQYSEGRAFRDSILSALQTKSTTISSNLAACAAAGEVDERIFNAVDYLINGNQSEQGVVDGILNWGSSSGIDTIAGFLTSLKTVELRSSANPGSDLTRLA